MRAIVLIMDGLGDRETLGETPLSAASTPKMDKLAAEGTTGLYFSVQKWVVPGSCSAMLGILGYDPIEDNSGRGVLAAVGENAYEEGALAARVNLATVKGEKVIDRRAGRIDDKKLLKKIEKGLNNIKIDGADVRFIHTSGHRGVLVVKSKKKLSAKLIPNDPEHGGESIWVKPASKDAKETAQLLNEWLRKSREVLENIEENAQRMFPANFVLMRGFGNSLKKLTPFSEKHGVMGGVVTGQDYLKGIGKAAGMNIYEISEHSLEENIKGIIKFTETDDDFILAHVKATDVFGHDGDFEGKKKAIEYVDDVLIPVLRESFDVIAITGDHATPVALKKHSGDPCPVLVTGGGIVRDSVKKFSERACMGGGLGIIEREELIKAVLSAIGAAKVVGA